MNTQRYTVERVEREETNDYYKAGAVEWLLMNPKDECIDVYPLRRMAKAAADALNAELENA